MSNDHEIGLGADDQAAATAGDLPAKLGTDGPPTFLPDLLKRLITIRMIDGRPIKGVLEAYNNYELHLDLGQNKRLIVFKGAISSIECLEKKDQGKPEAERTPVADR